MEVLLTGVADVGGGGEDVSDVSTDEREILPQQRQHTLAPVLRILVTTGVTARVQLSDQQSLKLHQQVQAGRPHLAADQ